MANPVQLGQAVELGIGGYTYEGYVVEGVDIEETGNTKFLTDEVDETVTRIDWDPGKKLSVEMYAKSGSDPESIRKGDTLTVNGVLYAVDDRKIKRQKGAEELKVTLDLEKKDSISYAAAP